MNQVVVRWKTDREFGAQIIALTNESYRYLARNFEHALQHILVPVPPVYGREPAGSSGFVHLSAVLG